MPGSVTAAVVLSGGRRPVRSHKQVTVLFADVVGSMQIASALGAERLREIMAELVNRCTSVVQRYGGTVDKFTGDGIMALFGAPVALEDHAFRACLAALNIQSEAKRLAAEVESRDGVVPQLRVGLNSGQVIAGEIGSSPIGYTAIGEQVGMAQRMESVAPPGGVMLSESTARLVDDAAGLGEPELVHIKGADAPVAVRRLLGIRAHPGLIGRREPTLVGRRWEMATVAGILHASTRRPRRCGWDGGTGGNRQEPAPTSPTPNGKPTPTPAWPSRTCVHDDELVQFADIFHHDVGALDPQITSHLDRSAALPFAWTRRDPRNMRNSIRNCDVRDGLSAAVGDVT
jgi:class 3 adenylate cyclase